jgi:hypothetical protein
MAWSTAMDNIIRYEASSTESRTVAIACFSALFFTALALVPAAAHVAEVVHKMQLSEAEYRVVQQIYAGWALFGIVIFAAIVSTGWLSMILRHEPRAFVPSLIALVSLVGTQVIFWTLTFPVNRGPSTGPCFRPTGAIWQAMGIFPCPGCGPEPDRVRGDNSCGTPTSCAISRLRTARDHFLHRRAHDVRSQSRRPIIVTRVRNEHCDNLCPPEL